MKDWEVCLSKMEIIIIVMKLVCNEGSFVRI